MAIPAETVDTVIAHIEKRVLARLSDLIDRAKDSDEQRIIAQTVNDILATIRQS